MTTHQNTTSLFTLSQQSHQVVHEQPIQLMDLDLLFIYIMRLPAIYSEACVHLHPQYFDGSEVQYAVFWAAYRDLRNSYTNVSYDMVANEINRRVAGSGMLTDDAIYQLIRQDEQGLVYSSMCRPLPYELPQDHARDLLRRFLHERSVARPIARVLSHNRGNSYPRELMQILDQAQQQSLRIEGIRSMPVGGLMPQRGAALPPPMQFTPTGLSFIDSYIKGQRAGDCNGLLGVFGSGKTSMGSQLAMENAQNYYNKHLQTGETPGLSIFLSYEEPQSKVEKRLWAYAARIRRDKLESMENWDVLTGPNNIEPYERQLSSAGADGVIYCEQERWDIAMQWYNKCFRLFDMSGSEDFPGVGAGYVSEAAAMLTRLSETLQQPIRSVTIDYAGLVCRRYMQANNIGEERTRYYLSGIGDQIRREIAEKHQCTVWLLHQFNGDQNKRSATTLLHHSDAAESKAFAENLAVCGCLGVEDKATGCRLLNWSKVRYYQDRSQSAPTLQIDGRFGCMVDVSSRFVPDERSGSFVDPSARQALEGESDAPRRPRGPVGLRTVDSIAGDLGMV